jgi:hypothetical protein
LLNAGSVLIPYIVPRVASAGDREAGDVNPDGSGGDAPDGGLDDVGDEAAFL